MESKLTQPKVESNKSGLLTNIDPKLGKTVIDANVDLRKKELDKDLKKEERGYLGQFFGGKDCSSNNIAGFFLLLLLVIGTLYTVVMVYYCPTKTHNQVMDFWGIITPLITLTMGYIFGNNQKP